MAHPMPAPISRSGTCSRLVANTRFDAAPIGSSTIARRAQRRLSRGGASASRGKFQPAHAIPKPNNPTNCGGHGLWSPRKFTSTMFKPAVMSTEVVTYPEVPFHPADRDQQWEQKVDLPLGGDAPEWVVDCVLIGGHVVVQQDQVRHHRPCTDRGEALVPFANRRIVQARDHQDQHHGDRQRPVVGRQDAPGPARDELLEGRTQFPRRRLNDREHQTVTREHDEHGNGRSAEHQPGRSQQQTSRGRLQAWRVEVGGVHQIRVAGRHVKSAQTTKAVEVTQMQVH